MNEMLLLIQLNEWIWMNMIYAFLFLWILYDKELNKEWYKLEEILEDSLFFAQDTMDPEGKKHIIPMISSTSIPHYSERFIFHIWWWSSE